MTEGGFTYEGSDTKARATLVIVKYFDNNQRKVSYVQDPVKADVASDAAITKYGIVEKQIEAFGVTSFLQKRSMRAFFFEALFCFRKMFESRSEMVGQCKACCAF